MKKQYGKARSPSGKCHNEKKKTTTTEILAQEKIFRVIYERESEKRKTTKKFFRPRKVLK